MDSFSVPNPPNLSIENKTTTSIEVKWLTPSPAKGAIIAYSVSLPVNVVTSYKPNAIDSVLHCLSCLHTIKCL